LRGNLYAEISSCAESSLESLLVGGDAGVALGRLGGEMALVTDTVDVDAVGLDELDDADGTGCLVAIVFNVVVVVL
jgi:hypothetical protein